MEIEVQKITRKTKIQKIILASVATAGILSMAMLAPNAIQTLKLFDKRKSRTFRQTLNNSRRRLIRTGLLENKEGFLKLTEKGRQKLEEFERRDYKLTRPKKWDQKWRVLIFDIPEKRKGTREKVRLTLQSLGFKHLQDSVWVFPYDCENLITLLKADFKIGKDMLYLIVEKIENDKNLIDYFGLEKKK